MSTFFCKKAVTMFFPGGSDGKASAYNAGDPGWEDLLEKEMATHSSICTWKIPWMEEPGRLQSMGLQRVGHDCATSLHFTSCEMINMLIRMILVNTSQCICISNLFVHFKYVQFLIASYTPVKLGQRRNENN